MKHRVYLIFSFLALASLLVAGAGAAESPELDLCRDIIQMEPDTVLFSYDGQDYTVEQCSVYIIRAVLSENSHQEPTPYQNFHLYELRSFCEDHIAVPLAAQELGIELTETELAQIDAAAREKDGYWGLSADYWYQDERDALLAGRLHAHFEETVPEDSVYTEYNKALGRKLGPIYRTLKVSFHMSTLTLDDILSIKNRAEQFPYGTFSSVWY